MSCEVKFDKAACMARVRNAAEGKALYIASEQVLKDCNYYCKQDQSGLINSSLIHSQPEKGRLIWKTPYAKKQYYLQTAHTDVNANASWMWCHNAKAAHKKEWKKAFETVFHNEMRRK